MPKKKQAVKLENKPLSENIRGKGSGLMVHTNWPLI